MRTFDLIIESHQPAAIIGNDEMHGHQFDPLYAILPEHSVAHFDLAQRWEAAFVLAPLDWAQAQRRREPMLRPKGFRMAFLALLLSALQLFSVSAFPVPPFPPVKSSQLVSAPKITNTWYFAATAVDTNGLESDYSDEVIFRSTTNTLQTITLAWDASPSTDGSRITYLVYTGPAPRAYTNTTIAGTNLIATIRLAPLPKTNLLYTLQPQVASNAAGPWLTLSNWPALRLTNPPGNSFYKFNVLRTNF